jgi:hypothetical protein
MAYRPNVILQVKRGVPMNPLDIAEDGTSSQNIVEPEVFNVEELAGAGDTKVSDYVAYTVSDTQPTTDAQLTADTAASVEAPVEVAPVEVAPVEAPVVDVTTEVPAAPVTDPTVDPTVNPTVDPTVAQ